MMLLNSNYEGSDINTSYRDGIADRSISPENPNLSLTMQNSGGDWGSGDGLREEKSEIHDS